MAHTPGPWTTRVPLNPITPLAANDRLVLARAFDGSEHTVTGRVRGGSPEEADANALLIAAAPELLECLRRMCGMYSAYSRRLAPLLAEDNGTVWTFERANSLALEAIAKAEGR